MDKAIFLDRDGVINKDHDYVCRIADFEFIPKAVEGLKKLQEVGYKLIIISNQSGIARDYYQEKDVKILHEYMLNELNKKSVQIDKIYYCPHHPSDGNGKYTTDCDCRKPKPGLIKKAVQEFNIDLKQSFFIGDKTADIQTGKNAGCATVLVKTGYGGRDKVYEVKPDFIFNNLFEAAEHIVASNK